MSDNVFAGSDVLDDLYGDEQFTQEDLTPKASRNVSKAGWYHAAVLAVKGLEPDHEGRFSVIRLDMQILAGEHADQKDSMYFHRVRLFRLKKDEHDKNKVIGREPYDRKFVAGTMKTAASLNLIPREEGARLSQANWENAVGAQVVIKIDADKEEYTDKNTGEKKQSTRYQCNWGNFFRMDDPESEKVPKDGEALAYLTGGQGVGGADISDL